MKRKPDYSSICTSELEWAQKYQTAKWDDTELALHASMVEHKALEAINGTKPANYGFPGVAALVLSRTLQAVANDAGDQQMLLYATEYEQRALVVIRLYLSCREPNETMN